MLRQLFLKPGKQTLEQQLDAATRSAIGELACQDCVVVADPGQLHGVTNRLKEDNVNLSHLRNDQLSLQVKHPDSTDIMGVMVKANHQVVLLAEQLTVASQRGNETQIRYSIVFPVEGQSTRRKILGHVMSESGYLMLGTPQSLLKAEHKFPELLDFVDSACGEESAKYVKGLGLIVQVPANRDIEVRGLLGKQGLSEVYINVVCPKAASDTSCPQDEQHTGGEGCDQTSQPNIS